MRCTCDEKRAHAMECPQRRGGLWSPGDTHTLSGQRRDVLGSDVPSLTIDATLYPSGRIPARGKLERRVVWALLAHMEAHGFRIVGVHDYETLTPVASAREAMEVVFNLDGCNLHFRDGDGEDHCAVLVLGNGTDVLSDWFARPGDAFDRALKAFDPTRCE